MKRCTQPLGVGGSAAEEARRWTRPEVLKSDNRSIEGEINIRDGVSTVDHIPGAMTEFRRRHPLYVTSNLIALALFGILAVMMMVVSPPDEGGAPASAPTSHPPFSARTTIVPNLVGMSARQGRESLLLAGLRFGRVKPAAGPPGDVVATHPKSGTRVNEDTVVTLIIGVEDDRLPRLRNNYQAHQRWTQRAVLST